MEKEKKQQKEVEAEEKTEEINSRQITVQINRYK